MHAIIQKLNAEIVRTVNRPEVRKQLVDMGAEPVGNTSAEMAAQIQSELNAFGAVARQIKLMVE